MTAAASIGGPSRSSTRQGEARVGAADPPHGGRGADGARRQGVGQARGSASMPSARRHEQAVPRARGVPLGPPRLPRLPQGAADQAAVVALHRQELRQGRLEAQLGRVGGVDPADQRLDQAFQHLAAEPPLDERGEALVAVVPLAGEHQVQEHPELAAPRQDRRRQDRPEPAGGHQHEPLRHRHEPPLPDHERAAVLRIGPDQLVGQPELAAEVDPPRLVGDERVGAPLQGEAVVAIGPDRAPDAVAGLEDDHLDRTAEALGARGDPVGRRQPREAAADDHHPVRARRVLGQGNPPRLTPGGTTPFSAAPRRPPGRPPTTGRRRRRPACR